MIFILSELSQNPARMGYNSSVEKNSPNNDRGQEAVKEAIEWTRGGKMAEAIPVFEEHLMELSKGSIPDRRVAASAFSYYGLCVATVRRKYGEGIKYCQVSLRSNSMDPDHRTNLAMVYLEGNDREKAIECLNAGLRLDRRNRRLNALLDRIGRRRSPVIAFLPRDNPLNVWLGKLRAERNQQ